ncbi:MAG: beta-ketoacyl-ACP reductase [Legionellaceae bacterium]|nr:beta-ketoacyl-ACP reductase [Legionellaceae bacterium]HCA89753.1 acetoacetyl-CoA reductase [Legionellales bacterium]|tara:strand:+ start:223 stop:969 length:747 start_codon:yes stop_codon:yes gene_type:complete
MAQDKVALITGGTGDIGTAIVKRLNSFYTQVIALDVVADDVGQAWQKDMHKQGYHHAYFQTTDVTDYKACQAVIHHIQQTHGRIDALINNAGITRDAVFHKMTKAQWDAVLSVNLDGMFNMTQPVVQLMREQQSGRIVNISSVNAQKGQFSQANYAAAKAGIYGFTKSLAQELMLKKITVNSVSPGYVDTHLMKNIRPDILADIIKAIPAQRLAHPDEIAWAVSFLIADESAYITGANLSINGGLHMY